MIYTFTTTEKRAPKGAPNSSWLGSLEEIGKEGYLTMATLADEGKSLSACETSDGGDFDFDSESPELNDLVVSRSYSEIGYGVGISLANPLHDDGEEPVSDDPVRDSISRIFRELKELRARLVDSETREKEMKEEVAELRATVADQDELITRLVNFIYWREGFGLVGSFEELYKLSQYYKAHPEELEERAKLAKKVKDGRELLKERPYDRVTKSEVNRIQRDIFEMDKTANIRMFRGEWESDGGLTIMSRHPAGIFGRYSPIMCEIREGLERKERRELALLKLEMPNNPSVVTKDRLDRLFSMLAAQLKNNAVSQFLAFSVIKRELNIDKKAMTRLNKHIVKDSRFKVVESGVPRAGRRVKMVCLSDEGKRLAIIPS